MVFDHCNIIIGIPFILSAFSDANIWIACRIANLKQMKSKIAIKKNKARSGQ
jgi:hypothetical protein